MTDNWINPEDRMPDPVHYSHPIELTHPTRGKRCVSGVWDDARSVWFDDERSSFLEKDGWRVTGWQPLPEPRVPVKHVRWVNFYDNANPTEHHTKEFADSYDAYYDSMNRIACVRVEFTEGEGL